MSRRCRPGPEQIHDEGGDEVLVLEFPEHGDLAGNKVVLRVELLAPDLGHSYDVLDERDPLASGTSISRPSMTTL